MTFAPPLIWLGSPVMALSAGLLSGAALAASPWDGTYTFEQPIGPGAGGLQLFVTHTLAIGPNGCTIVAQGYQTNEQPKYEAIRG